MTNTKETTAFLRRLVVVSFIFIVKKIMDALKELYKTRGELVMKISSMNTGYSGYEKEYEKKEKLLSDLDSLIAKHLDAMIGMGIKIEE